MHQILSWKEQFHRILDSSNVRIRMKISVVELVAKNGFMVKLAVAAVAVA